MVTATDVTPSRVNGYLNIIESRRRGPHTRLRRNSLRHSGCLPTVRRHRPGRAFERTDYRFELVTDYGAFRDLQRHRMAIVEHLAAMLNR